MPRIRSLKPELVSDVKLASVSRDARYTFILMITQADDAGLLAGAHRQLLGALYPLDEDVTIGVLLAWIEQLVAVGLVRWLATRDGVPVLQITNWTKHQRIDNAGRSQLGALLAESPRELPNLAELRREPPRGLDPASDPRGLDHRPPTTDLGSPVITDVSVSDAACVLSRAANRGLAEHPKQPQAMPPIIATGGRTHEATVAILEAGIPIPFAESAIYELAKNHTADRTVKSLMFFVEYAKRRWAEHKAAEDMKNSTAPAPLARKEHWKEKNERLAIEADAESERKRVLGNVMARRARTEDGDVWWARMQNEFGRDDQLGLYAYAFKRIGEPGTLPAQGAA